MRAVPSASTLAEVARLLTARTGLRVPAHRREDLRRAWRAATAGRQGLLPALAADPAVFEALVDAFAVGETRFFREPAQLDFVRERVLRPLAGRPAPPRLWSAGCATGEEAYTLAIMLLEEGLAPGALLLATDLSRRALETAAEAVYGPWSLRGLDAARRDTWFMPEGSRFRLLDAARRVPRFAHLNLADPVWPPDAARLDLVLCRNVFIHLARPAVRAIARRLFDALAPGGWLVLGPSDPLLGPPFEVQVGPAGVYYRRPSAAPPPPAVVTAAPPPPTLGAAVAPPELEPPADADACAAWLSGQTAGCAPAEVEARCAALTARHPLSAPLAYLHAVALAALGRAERASTAVRRALYLDRSMVAAHGLLGALRRQSGDAAGAARAWGNACRLLSALPADAVVPLAGGERAGALSAVFRALVEDIEDMEARR